MSLEPSSIATPEEQIFDSVDRNGSSASDGTPEPQQASKSRKNKMLEELTADADWYMTSFSRSDRARDSSVRISQVKEKFLENLEAEPPRKRPAPPRSKPQPKRVKVVREKKEKKETPVKKENKEKKEGSGSQLSKKQQQMAELLEAASYFTSLGAGDTDSFLRRVKPVVKREPSPPPAPVPKMKKKKKQVPKMLVTLSYKQKKAPKQKTKKEAKPAKRGTKKEVKKELKKLVKKEETPQAPQKEVPYFVSWADNRDVPVGDRKLFLQEVYEGAPTTIDVASLVTGKQLVENNRDFFTDKQFGTEVELASPLSEFRETYILSFPKDQLLLNPLEEIGRIMELVAITYLPEPLRKQVVDFESEECILARYVKAIEAGESALVAAVINEYNELLDTHRSEIVKNAAQLKQVPMLLYHEILNQCYARTVSPNSQKLRTYKAFSNFVYGELLPSFLTTVYNQVGLNHTHKFIDLGSGVGNCTLQASLEYGAESAGCEIMEHASTLSELQLVEFEQRCRLYGIQTGKVEYFLRQGFEEHPSVEEYVSSSDIILVNNYLFDAELNQKVVKLFRNLKVGTKIISLKPIVPHGYTIDLLDLECILNRTSYVQHSYTDNSVSWTSTGGVYYISTVEKDIIPAYFVEHSVGRTRAKNSATMTPTETRSSTPFK